MSRGQSEPGSGWLLRELREGHRLRLTSIGGEFPLTDIYLDVLGPQGRDD